MFLQAAFTREDLARALAQLTPARVQLDKHNADRYLALARPREVLLVPGRGVCVVTQAQVQWDLIGIRVPLTLRHVSVLLSPSIERVKDEHVLSFAAQIEDADLSALPGFVEDTIIARVNGALARPEARLTWPFMRKLDFHFALPASLEPRRDMNLFARWGAVQVSAEALTLSVSWGLSSKKRASTGQFSEVGEGRAQAHA